MNPVTGVVVSRMDRSIGAVLDPIIPHVEDLIVSRGHGGVGERYPTADAVVYTWGKSACPLIYTQDDDAIVDVAAVIAAYKPGLVVCNMPADRRNDYRDGIALVGWGAIFDAVLVDKAFRRYWGYALAHGLVEAWNDDVFRSEADRIFTGLSDLELIDVPFEHCEAAHGNDRMGRRANHGAMLAEARKRIYAVRGER